MDDVARYLAIRSAYGPSLRDDGEELAFLLDTTGHAEIWSVWNPRDWPEQRTFGEDPIAFCTYVPDSPDIVFGRDEGGNERVQFFRLDAASGYVESLTASPEAKHYWGGWANNASNFAFASNRREEAVFDVYVQSADESGDAAECVYESDTWLVPAGFDPTDERLVVQEMRASFDTDLYVLQIDDGELTLLSSSETTARYLSPQWGPDGRYIYCVTDEGADTRYLARIDADGGPIESVYEGGDWNVDGISIDNETGRAVYTRNVEGYTEVSTATVADGSFRSIAEPDLPEGVAGGVSFGPDAERFAITHTARAHNPSVYVVASEDGTAECWTAASTAGIPRETFRSPDIVSISSVDDLEIPGFLTLPDGAEAGATPVIVDIHGGPESQRRPSFDSLTQYFVANGYAIFEPNVRGSSGYGAAYAALDDVERRMDSVADLAACADWLAEHQLIDPNRIVAKGGSYGGFMVLAALTEYPDHWAAGIDIVGIANFVTFLENTGSWRREHREAEYGSLEHDRDFLEAISPINNIERIKAPLFVIHGKNDPRVPVGEAEQIAEAASDHVPVETLVFEDEGHGIAKLDNRIETYRRVIGFLDDHL